MAIDATVGGASANSYVTLAEADAYFSNRLHTSSWDALTDPQKEASLIWATNIIGATISEEWTKEQLPNDATIRILSNVGEDSSAYIVWTGSPANSTQALSWPRSGMANRNGFDISSTEIPQQLKDFQCEVALKLSAEDRTEENAAATQGLNRLKAGDIELGWDVSKAENARLIPDYAIKMLVPSWWYAFELMYQKNSYSRLL